MSNIDKKHKWSDFVSDLKKDQLPFDEIDIKISNGVHFYGSPLFILIFSSLIASIGLNIDSTPMVLGAKLISPIMVMIIGMGYGISTYKFKLSKRALIYFLVQFSIILLTSTIYFIISPIKIPTNELLTKINVSIFDILVAFFGGSAAVIATTRYEKYNVLPGVALATSLLPPVCTVGYGIATLNPTFILGAFYLFAINVIFIMLAVFVFFKIISKDEIEKPNKNSSRIKQHIFVFFAVLMCLPVLISSFNLLKNSYSDSIDKSNMYNFIKNEFNFPRSTLLESTIDTDTKNITILVVGDYINEAKEEILNDKLSSYHLSEYNLELIQGSENVVIEFFKDLKNETYK